MTDAHNIPPTVRTLDDLEALFRANGGNLGLKYDGGRMPILNDDYLIVGYLGSKITTAEFAAMQDRFLARFVLIAARTHVGNGGELFEVISDAAEGPGQAALELLLDEVPEGFDSVSEYTFQATNADIYALIDRALTAMRTEGSN